MANGRPKKRKKVRYSEVRIRLSYRQKRSLINYCHARKTTPNKLIKKMIRKYISNFADDVPEEYYATENQLDLFGEGFEDEFEDTIYHEEEEEVEENRGLKNEDRGSKTEDRVSSIEYRVSNDNMAAIDIEEGDDTDDNKNEEDEPLTLF